MQIHGIPRSRGPGRPTRHAFVTGWLAACVPAVAIWLFLAAIPVLADGGPHVQSINNGSQGINADSCAGCHRAHTAAAPNLLVEEGNLLCLSCHGATGTGASTDVADGVQYTLSTSATAVRGTTILGALRNGGFDNAAIGSDVAYAIGYDRAANTPSRHTKVPVKTSNGVLAWAPVNSSHIPGLSGLTTPGVVWGNGDITTATYAGPVLNAGTELECTSCHNPHGNGQYRILNPIPDLTGEVTGGTFLPVSAKAVVTDDTTNTGVGSGTRNYTVIQLTGSSSLLASQVQGYANTAGDYFHRRIPWNSSGQTDAPNGLASTFNTQMTAWCSSCHTRYYEPNADNNTGDAVYKYRHDTTSNRACTTCHVAHGSNAAMKTPTVQGVDWPGSTTPRGADSLLLKIDNRGTGQACHDPTQPSDVPTPPTAGPTPTPLVP